MSRFSAASVLGRYSGLQDRPRPASKIGRVYDRLLADRELNGVTTAELCRIGELAGSGALGRVLIQLRDYYWCDIRRLRPCVWALYSTPHDDRLARKMGAA